MKIGVLADDFTGAGDVGLMFEKAGLAAEITIVDSLTAPRPPDGKTQVWIIDTESRALPPQKAALRVRAAMRALNKWKTDRFYKKIDSTLRGNLGAELAEFMRALPNDAGRSLPFIPAFPRAGRTVRNGNLYVDGKPLAETAFARDPRLVARSSSVAKVVGPLAPLLWIPDVRNQADLRRAIKKLSARDGNIFAADVPSDTLARPLAAAGAAGFVEELAKGWGGGKKSALRKKKLSKISSPVLLVVGSFHPQSRRQLAYVKQRTKNAPVFIVQSPDHRASPGRAMKKLVERADLIAKQFNIRRFVVTGGETAAALCRRWNLRRWKIVASVDTGTPVCRPIESSGADWLMVMKPGGFGKENILARAVQHVA